MGIKRETMHRDGSPKIYATPAIKNTYLYFTSCGDDINNKIIGGGQPMIIEGSSDGSPVQTSCQFLEDIYLKDGMLFWENAVLGDSLTIEVVLPAYTLMPHPTNNGNANLDSNGNPVIIGNMTPDETWVGEYLYLPIDYPVFRFVNKLHLIGSNCHGLILESSDAALIQSIFKFIITYENTRGIANPNFKAIVGVELYRMQTV
jgi:hypothetical protein